MASSFLTSSKYGEWLPLYFIFKFFVYQMQGQRKSQNYFAQSLQATTSPLMQLRHRIVKFLGDLGGNINTAVVKGGKIPDISNAVGWSTAQHLSFALPFCDMKPTVYLGM